MRATSVRRAVADDAGAIAGVHVRSWLVAYRGLVPDAVLDGLSYQQRELSWRDLLSSKTDKSFTLVVERDGGVAGFCSVTTASRDEDASDGTCEVAAIYVEPDTWRAGVGGALLDRAICEAREDGGDEVTLWVFTVNEAARALYDRVGFKPDGAEAQVERTGQTEVRLRVRLTI